MPIYEFYCADCHTIYSFLSHRVERQKRPDCPICGRKQLDRRVSRFAISKGRAEPGAEEGGMPDLDDAKMEQALAALSGEGDDLGSDDPRQMARMMRKLYETTGLRLSEHMEEAMRRMEAGEDPDKVEEEMGDLLDDDDPLMAQSGGLGRFSKKLKAPRVDKNLYDL
jgi:putative FmdB family regulatory protein